MNTVPVIMIFEYAIKFPNGTYFSGPHYDHKAGKYVYCREGEKPLSSSNRQEAYTYTERRAYNILRDNQHIFKGCVVERLP